MALTPPLSKGRVGVGCLPGSTNASTYSTGPLPIPTGAGVGGEGRRTESAVAMKQLTIHHIPADADHSARVRVSYQQREGAQPQVRETDFAFDLVDDERKLIQWYLEEYLTFPWADHRAHEAEALMVRKGEELFNAVFSGTETGRLFAHVVDELGQTRIVIHASDPAGIAIPWELMRDPSLGDYGELARLCYAFTRSQPDLFFEAPEPTSDGTFNILLVICRPAGENDVDFQSVARPLLEIVKKHADRITVDVLRPPTFEQLGKVLGERPGHYHVLHFDGHGGFPQPTAGGPRMQFYGGEEAQGRLWFEADDGTGRPVPGSELGALLAGKGVPVVVLNACQSGMTHPEAVYSSVGNQLLQAGVGGVVAMAYSVYVTSAVKFVTRLYENLVNGEDLARAVALGRETLRTDRKRLSAIGELDLNDWVVPVLLEASPVRLTEKPRAGAQPRVKLSTTDDEQARSGLEVDCPEPPAFGFIGRDNAVFTLERAFRAETIVLLEGMAGVGKTETSVGFARWLADTGALDGPIFFNSFEKRTTLFDVCNQVGKVFGPSIKQQINTDWHLLEPDQRRDLAVDILKQVSCLMIWDNFEPVHGFPTGTPSEWTDEEQAELRKFLVDLRGGATKVLISSRRDEPWLGPIYRRVPLGGLSLAESQQLAVRVLERTGASHTKIKGLADYNALIQYLGGNPLAIQVILPELTRLTPTELLRQLQIGEARLSADDPALGRTRSLASSLTYRLDRLDPVHRQRFGVLGMFQGFIDAQVVANISSMEGAPRSIAGLDRDAWIAELNLAAEIGLMRSVGDGYYRPHPALPWFFHDTMLDVFDDQGAWIQRAFVGACAAYAQWLFQTSMSDAQLVFGLFSVEEPNFLHALNAAYREEAWDVAAKILEDVGAIYTLWSERVKLERLVVVAQLVASGDNGQAKPGRETLWLVVLANLHSLAQARGSAIGKA